jgi:DNA polymerase-3 subunit delta
MTSHASKGSPIDPFASPKPVYIFHGEDDIKKDELINKIKQNVVDPDFTDFDFESLDASIVSPDDILAAANLAPFGSKRRMVLVIGAEIYRNREKSSDADTLADGISRLNGAGCLVLRVGSSEEDASRQQTVLTKRIDQATAKVGEIVSCNAMKQEELIDWMREYVSKAGKNLDSQAAMRLYEFASKDRQTLRNELEKIICFVGNGRKINIEDVNTVCGNNPEDVIFKLVDAVTSKDAGRTLSLYQELTKYDTKSYAVMGRLLAMLNRQFKLLSQAYELNAMNLQLNNPDSIPEAIRNSLPSDANLLRIKWKVRDYARMAKLWNREEIANAFDLLLNCDLANKGEEIGCEDPQINMQLTLLQLSLNKSTNYR